MIDIESLYQEHHVDEWVDRYGDALFAYALKRLRDPGRAEEVVQEALLAALESLDTFAGHSSLQTWLTGILRYKILDQFRQIQKEDTVREEESAGELLDRLYDERGHWRAPLAAWNPSPEVALESEEFLRALQLCLQGLPQKMSAVFHLREIDELESEEICKELKITAANYWAIMHRARMRLRTCLDKSGFGEKESEC